LYGSIVVYRPSGCHVYMAVLCYLDLVVTMVVYRPSGCHGCMVVLCYLDLVVVIASLVVLAVGSNGQVFATSAIR